MIDLWNIAGVLPLFSIAYIVSISKSQLTGSERPVERRYVSKNPDYLRYMVSRKKDFSGKTTWKMNHVPFFDGCN